MSEVKYIDPWCEIVGGHIPHGSQCDCSSKAMPHVFPGNVATIAAQIGSSLMPDNEQWMNRFTVKSSSSSSIYTVAQRRADGVWGCSCRGWIHYRHCKHLTDILGRLARIPTLAVHEVPAGDEEFSNVIDILASARAAYQEHQR